MCIYEGVNNIMKLLDVIQLTEDVLIYNLKTGEQGTIVHVHNDGKAFEVEFVDKEGYTYALVCLEKHQIKKVNT